MTTSTTAGAAVSPAGAGRQSARERLLAAAEELFYVEGVNTVGIDRVIERAGVAKATLYSVFGSKEELVRAYLERHNENWSARLTGELARRGAGASPAARILLVFDIAAERAAEPTYHGCAFVSATAEARPGSLVQQAADGGRAWLTDLFAELAGLAGAAGPAELARQLALLYHGAALSVRIDGDRQAFATARAATVALLAAATDRAPG